MLSNTVCCERVFLVQQRYRRLLQILFFSSTDWQTVVLQLCVWMTPSKNPLPRQCSHPSHTLSAATCTSYPHYIPLSIQKTRETGETGTPQDESKQTPNSASLTAILQHISMKFFNGRHRGPANRRDIGANGSRFSDVLRRPRLGQGNRKGQLASYGWGRCSH